jgi:sulfate transport system permease protein
MARQPRPAPAGADAPPPAPAAAAPAERHERDLVWSDVWDNIGRAAWTLVVWGLFILVVLGPLATVVAFSMTSSVFQGFHPTLVQYREIASSPANYYPLVRSFEVALIVVAVQLVLGTVIAYSIVRRKVFGANLMDAMSNLTIALPSVVIGLALLSFYGPFGPFHTFSAWAFSRPLALTWTLWIVVLAHTLETFPYMVRTVGSVLGQVPKNLESAAHSLGAGRFTVFRTVLLPQIKQSLLAGSVLVFSRSIAEFGATIIVVSAVLRTAPIRIYSEAEAGRMELAAAYSVILMAVSLVVYLGLRRAAKGGLSSLEMQGH